MVQNTERLCRCGFNAEHITNPAFQCSNQKVTFRARLHGTANATSVQLIENIQQWVNTKIPVAVRGVRVNTETCPVAITSFRDPQCVTHSTFDNLIAAIVGGAAAVIIILILTVIVIAVCVRKNQKYKYSTDQDVE